MKQIMQKLPIILVIILTTAILSACNSKSNKVDSGNIDEFLPTESLANESPDAVESNNNASSQEDELEKYCINSVLSDSPLPNGQWVDLVYSEDYPPENLWFNATVKATENDDDPQRKYIAVSLDGEYIGALDKNSNAVLSPFLDGIACIVDNKTGERKLINTAMVDVTSKYVDLEDGEQIVALGADKTGITLWTRKNTDTYDSHTTDLFAKDLNGHIKQTWNSKNELTEAVESVDFIEHINGSVYFYCYYDNYVLLNVENGNAFSVGELHSDIRLDTMFDDGSFMTESGNGDNYIGFTWYSPAGDEQKKLLLYEEVARSSYSDGLMYVKGEVDDSPYQGFVDETGNFTINLDVDLNITNLPVYREGYALIELKNEGGETFVTLLDKAGNFAFEPIKGKAISSTKEICGELEEKQFCIRQNDDCYYLNLDGSIEKAEYDLWKCFDFLDHTYMVSDDSIQIIK